MRSAAAAWLIVTAALAAPAAAEAPAGLAGKTWIHGSEDCGRNRDPPLEVFRFDADSYVLRQNKCLNFEAPFIYVLFGEHTALVLDTGATEDAAEFPLYETVRQLIAERKRKDLRILVVHSHSHGDHRAADAQFRGRPGVTLVEANAEAVRRHFGFPAWPKGSAVIDLGGRQLDVIPSPGHQDEGIVLYDARNGWLLTGDNLYPGRLYVRDWNEFRASIARLVEFANQRKVSAVLGAHIELSKSGQPFEAGSTFQPGEASLVLTATDLAELGRVLRAAGDEPREIATARFVVSPVGAFWRVLGDFIAWFRGD